MQALICSKYGPASEMELMQVNRPEPADNEVLIKIHATSVNRTDCAYIAGRPFIVRFITGLFRPRKKIPGTEFAGEIVETGKNVTAFKIGQRVFGLYDPVAGSHVQYMTIPEDMALTTIPDKISYKEAAVSTEGVHYAINLINKVNLKKEHSVLINGASGGIGSAALQLVKYYGAHVTAVCDTKNVQLIKSLGADKVIDYLKEDFTGDDQKYHFVFDAVGKSTFGKCKPLLHPGGVYMSSELGPGAQNIFLPLLTALFGKKKVIFPIPLNRNGSVFFIKELLEQGKYKPVIDREYPFDQIIDAYKYVDQGLKTGNVVINIV